VLVREVVDVVESLSLDEAFLDVTDLDRPVRALRELVVGIREQTGLTYSVGIGPNKLCAKVLSDWRKPSAFNVASREQCCVLFADRSPGIINGIGPKSVARLEQLGIDTIARLREVDGSMLAVHFGQRRAAELQARARFEHEGRVQARRERRSMSEERTFDVDVVDGVELVERLRVMSVDLCQALRQRELRGRTIGIKVRLADFTTITRSRTIDERTCDAETVVAVAEQLLREYGPQEPVRLLGVRVAGFEDPHAGREDEQAYQLRLDVEACVGGNGASLVGARSHSIVA
jgi:DNA polymerase IV